MESLDGWAWALIKGNGMKWWARTCQPSPAWFWTVGSPFSGFHIGSYWQPYFTRVAGGNLDQSPRLIPNSQPEGHLRIQKLKKRTPFGRCVPQLPTTKMNRIHQLYIYSYILYCSSPEVREKAMEERNNQQPLEVSHHFNFSAFQLRSLCLQTASPSARAELFEIFLQRCRGGKCCGWDAMKISISPRKRGEIHGNSQMVGKQLVVSTIDGGNDEE